MRAHGPPISVIWSLLWRAIVMLPFAVAVSFLALFFFVAIVALPIAAGLYAYAGDWPSAAACLGGSVLAAWATRWLWRHHCAGDSSRAGFVS
jgi:hypothetical protein